MRRLALAIALAGVLAVAGVVVARSSHGDAPAAANVATATAQPTVPHTQTAAVTSVATSSDAEEVARRSAVDAVALTSAVFRAGFISRRDVIAAIATPRFAPQLADDTSRQINDLLVGLGRRTQDVGGLAVVEQPITASITLTGTRATASVWSVLVIVVPGAGAGRQLWRTTTMELELVAGRWLVDAWSSTPGPSPAPAAEGVFDDARAFAPVMGWPAAYGEVR